MANEEINLRQNPFPLPYRREFLTDFLSKPPSFSGSSAQTIGYGEYLDCITTAGGTCSIQEYPTVGESDSVGVLSLACAPNVSATSVGFKTRTDFVLSQVNTSSVFETRIKLSENVVEGQHVYAGFSNFSAANFQNTDFVLFYYLYSSPTFNPNWRMRIRQNIVSIVDIDTGVPFQQSPGPQLWQTLKVAVNRKRVSFSINGNIVGVFSQPVRQSIAYAPSVTVRANRGLVVTTELLVDYASLRYSIQR